MPEAAPLENAARGGCSKTMCRPESGRSAAAAAQAARPAVPGRPTRVRWGRALRPGKAVPHNGRVFPCHSPFCVRNRSDPKTTERDAESARIFVVRTCGFRRKREYWGLSHPALFSAADSWSPNCSGVILRQMPPIQSFGQQHAQTLIRRDWPRRRPVRNVRAVPVQPFQVRHQALRQPAMTRLVHAAERC